MTYTDNHIIKATTKREPCADCLNQGRYIHDGSKLRSQGLSSRQIFGAILLSKLYAHFSAISMIHDNELEDMGKHFIF